MADFDFSSFIAAFFDEARDILSAIDTSLVQFEEGVLDDEGLISLRRNAHTIKGSALMLGITDIGNAGHLFEDIMEDLIKNESHRTEDMIQFLFELRDTLEVRLGDIDGKNPIDVDQLHASYAIAMKQTETPKPAPQIIEKDEVKAEVKADVKLDVVDEVNAIADSINIEDFSFSQPEDDDAIIMDDMDDSTFSLIDDDELKALDKEIERFETVTPTPSQGATESIEDADFFDHDPKDNPFRPHLDNIEMKATQQKSSGHFLRIDSQRLEDLSNHIIEMSAEKTHVVKMESDFRQIFQDMRHLHSAWRRFHSQMKVLSVTEQEKGMSLFDKAIASQLDQSKFFLNNFQDNIQKRDIIEKELRDQVLGLMLRPLDSIFSTFPRAVRDTAKRAKKKVKLIISGEFVELDQGVSEQLVEVFVHLINNSIAHGFETPEERARVGKIETGQLTIHAQQLGNEVKVRVIDDGRGIDPHFVKKIAVERGVTTQYEADKMDTAEALELIFRPGFSTRDNVDSLSGRGIGMNVVQDTLRKLTGNIRIQSTIGQGTVFEVSLPVSIAVQHALIFRIGMQRFGLLAHMVEQVVLYDEHANKSEGHHQYEYQDTKVPLVDLRQIFLNTSDEEYVSAEPTIIIAKHIEGYVGIIVDELLEDTEVVVRDLDPYLKRYQAPGLIGNTIIDDSSVLMLIDPYGIKEMGRTAPDQDLSYEVDETTNILDLKILLVDDSLIARSIESSLLESMGFDVDTAIDGMDALDKMSRRKYDVLITDLEMPRLDGFGLVRRVRGNAELNDLPIMVISTRESKEDRIKCLKDGANAYMIKQQLKPEALMEKITEMVEATQKAS
ncbi:MAG: response regulator [Mariprofundaceae bacterium]|nr:response regulator [Mariprofundaceae bacterium]